MIQYGNKKLFDTGADCIVNTVNCQEHIKGPDNLAYLTTEFEKRFPASHEPLRKACASGLFKPGMVQIVRINRNSGSVDRDGDLFIAHVAVRDKWEGHPKLDWIRTGARKLALRAEQLGLKSISIPQLGVDYENVSWAQAQNELHESFEPLSRKGMKVFLLGDDVSGLADRKVKPFFYGGIGARDTPKETLEKMYSIGKILAARSGTLRSGGADGADDAFEQGAKSLFGEMEIFLPSETFNGRRADGKSYISKIPEEAFDLCDLVHPAPHKLGVKGRNLMARNGLQVLGPNLSVDAKSDVMICYTENGVEKGGTGQAIRLAKRFRVPMINLGDPAWADRCAESIAGSAVRIARGETTFEFEKKGPGARIEALQKKRKVQTCR